LLDIFLNGGEVVVSTKGRIANSEEIFSASKNTDKAPNLPMIVLINNGSASSSEIVAGALQDHKRAIIMGQKSYGKGSVQTFYPLDKRSAMKITTGIYYTPSGKSIQAEGIQPDIVVDYAKVEYQKKDDNQFKYGETMFKNYLKNEQSEKESEEDKGARPKEVVMSDTYIKDFQYARAYDLLQGIIILENQNERKQ